MTEAVGHPADRIQRQTAVALGYRPGVDAAPRVVAKGEGRVAGEIVRVALENRVPLREDRDLARVLSRLDLDSEIPTELYPAVAEVLGFIYRMNAAYDAPSAQRHDGLGVARK